MDQRTTARQRFNEFREMCLGKSVDELFALFQGKDSRFLFAVEVNIQDKADRGEKISDEGCLFLAIQALVREVNNGGYNQFFLNTSRMYAPIIVESLVRIGCPEAAMITTKAIEAIHPDEWTHDAIAAAVAAYGNTESGRWKKVPDSILIKRLPVDEQDAHDAMRKVLGQCDKSFYSSREYVWGHLIEFVLGNKKSILA